MTEPELDLPNKHTVDGNILSAGQPSRAKLETARRAGTTTIINLRQENEFSEYDEAAVAAELRLRYVHIPIAEPQDLTRDNALALDRALANEQGTPAIVHYCSSRISAPRALVFRVPMDAICTARFRVFWNCPRIPACLPAMNIGQATATTLLSGVIPGVLP